MKFSREKTIQSLRVGAIPKLFVAFILSMSISACVTTGQQEAQALAQNNQSIKQQARKSCDAPTGQKMPSSNSPQSIEQKAQDVQNCLPKGVIEIVENNVVDPEIKEQFEQAVALLKDEKYPEAIRLLKAVTGKTSKLTGPHINLGIAYARTDEFSKAEASLQKALDLNGAHPVALNEMGLVYRKTGRYSEARNLYETLLRLYPDFLPVRKNLGVLCDIYIQDLACALENYQAYLEGIPEDEKVKIWVADVKSRM